ncbi:MAG: hypothetical protein RL497_3111 [Pseudomonadota bacterium]|jgi:hypothetical protein
MDLWVSGVLILSGLSVLSALGFLLLKKQQKLTGELNRCLGQLDAVEKSLSMQNSIAIGMGQRILSLEQKIQAARVNAGEPAAAEDFSYTQAMQMFDRGLDAATVSASCGISRSEAQLMELIRKQGQATHKAEFV